jgi:aspartate aminotransferase
MPTLSRKVQQGEESQTLAIATKAKRLKDSGIDIVSLTAGEPDFPTPRHIKEAAIKAIEANFTKYTANEGAPDLIQAIIKKLSLENGLHFEPDQILVSNGAKQSIYNALQAICNKGDEVVIITPYWVSYPEMVKLVDAVPIFVKTTIEQKFKPDVRSIRRAINEKTKALIINSPNNPTGTVYTRSLLEEIAAVVKETGIYVISDEIYEKVLYDGARHFSIGSLRGVKDLVITVNGVSKAFSMTGWRIGYMGGPIAVMKAAAKFQSQVTSNANSIAQKATVAALSGSTNDLDAMVAEFKRRRDFVIDSLSAIREVKIFVPEGAFYVFFGVEKFLGRKFNGQLINKSTDLAEYLLEKHGVATMPGFAFGDDKCLRISYACSMGELEKGMKRLKAALEGLNHG